MISTPTTTPAASPATTPAASPATTPAASPATWAFTCYNLETASAIVQASEQARRPVILLVSELAFREPTGRGLVRALTAIAAGATSEVSVQLDHVRDIELIRQAFELGVDAVMADGSALAFDENIALVQRAVGIATHHGGWVEAELGALAGDEDRTTRAEADSSQFTSPDRVEEFVTRSGAAMLAVAIGNVHGKYLTPPQLQWELLDRLTESSPVPLALHGASGLAESDIRRAVAAGIGKINVNTELREQYFADLDRELLRTQPTLDVLSLNRWQWAGAGRVAQQKLALA